MRRRTRTSSDARARRRDVPPASSLLEGPARARLRTIALVVVVAAAGCFGRPKPVPPADQPAAAPVVQDRDGEKGQPKADFVTTAAALVKEFLDDPKAARMK